MPNDQCQVHESNFCLTCDEFYNSSDQNGTCVINECTCPNGKPVRNKECVVNQGVQCKSCNTGYTNLPTCEDCSDFYHLEDGGLCEKNECICPNGDAVRRNDCKEDGGVQCVSCNDFYHLEEEECQEKIYYS